MEFGLAQLDELLVKKQLQIEDGVKLVCGDKICPVIYRDGQTTVIEFDAPFIYVLIEKLGKINIFDIKRKINKIIIGEKSITIDIDDFPDITRDRPW